MLDALLNFACAYLGACSHTGRRSRVFTINDETYFVCWECCQRVPYDWANMRILKKPAGAERSVGEAVAESAH